MKSTYLFIFVIWMLYICGEKVGFVWIRKSLCLRRKVDLVLLALGHLRSSKDG